ncbi:MAG: bifunctional 4-hydroxy-2-oxoglutarate aldolase/2-dehydro-3-deoxy-phosphogluconate aldolase [Solirubrobacteraceae bacterium]
MRDRDPIALLERTRLLAVVRRAHVDDVIADTLEHAGIEALEISLESGNALESIARWRERFPTLTVGAGTVTTPDRARRAIDAGAAFLISPGLHAGVTEVAAAAGVPYIPGALTPSEVGACAVAGLTMIKIFPAARMGAAYVRDILAVFPTLRLIPTGGVDVTNGPEFLGAGATALAVGSALVGPDTAPVDLADRAREFTALVSTSPLGGA